MKAKDIGIAILILLVIAGIWLFVNEKKKNNLLEKVVDRLTNENESLKKSYLDLLQRYLIIQKETAPDILEELEKLKDQFVTLNKDVHIELKSVIQHMDNGNGAKAVKDLAKIIENILKEKVLQDQSFKKKPMLANLLEHAKNCNWINPQEHAYGELLREIRNKESHELNVQVEPHRIGLAIFSGIQIIYSLSQTT